MTMMLMLFCDHEGCTKKLVSEDVSKTRLFAKARKHGWGILEKRTGRCICNICRLKRNGGMNNMDDGEKIQ